MAETTENTTDRQKYRRPAQKHELINRLNRIEGQIRGIKNMVEGDRYCVDILTQVSAVQAALNSFNKEIMGNHIMTCVVSNIQEGNLDVVDELCRTVQKFMK